MKPQDAFDTDVYIEHQIEAIRAALKDGPAEAVIEFGGKVVQDRHTARVLPGYREDAKLELVHALMPDGEPVFAVSAKDIVDGRIRGDFRTRYDEETLRSIAALKERGIEVRIVAITRMLDSYRHDARIAGLVRTLEERGIEVRYFYEIEGYDGDCDLAAALDRNDRIETAKPYLLVLSPGGGSGKFNVCLSQLYSALKEGKSPGYVKIETFPVHDLPVDHPLHLAFMAATADLHDVVTTDTEHASEASSYRRDMHNHTLLRRLVELFPERSEYLRDITSATSMGINRLSTGIVDDEAVRRESAAEVARRLARYRAEHARGETPASTVERARELLKHLWEN